MTGEAGRHYVWMRTFAVALCLAATGCATVQAPSVQPNIYVMRHLHTPEGAKDPDLTAEGRRHARLLVAELRRDPPDVIYVSSTKRAQQTAEPLARRLKLAPKIYNPADTPGLVTSVLQEPGTVLVVGHSNTVPEIIDRLGGRRPPPLIHENFGDIWHIAGPDRQTSREKLGD